MKSLPTAITVCTLFLAASIAAAQTSPVTLLTPQHLIQITHQIQKNVDAQGYVGHDFDKDATDYTTLSVRTKSGQAEFHEAYTDVFVVVSGHATLVTGGTLVNGKTIGPGERLGTSINNGTRMSLSVGDIVHIPLNTPHQLLVPHGTTFSYFVVKIKEK